MDYGSLMKIIRREYKQSKKQQFNQLPEILQRIYAARDIEVSQLNKNLKALVPYQQLKGIDEATKRLSVAIGEQQRILIVGDFDADGATSTSVAVKALKLMGAEQVEYLVPNRFEYGYGLTPEIVEVAQRWKPKLIVTVDNGISSVEGVEAAKNVGIDVVITDHHLAGDVLPDACAIVNPNQPGCEFPCKSIAGVGVIYYVMLALRRLLVEQAYFTKDNMPNMASLLDLVALGTVADVVSLDYNNRILVEQGINRIRQGQCSPGIIALLKQAKRELSTLKASDLGFAIAPRLNAAGRLDDMSLGIACLLSDSLPQAQTYAKQLDELNAERKAIEQQMKEQALAALDNLSLSHQELPLGLCLYQKEWHQGVIGILAGRIKEKFHRPVIAFALSGDDELKGSARSITGLHIRDLLDELAKLHPDIITKFGGHAMAAGLSIKLSHYEKFKLAFAELVGKYIDKEQCVGQLITDGELTTDEINLDTAMLLEQAGPWGQHFPEPSFDNTFELIEQRIVGMNHLKLRLAHPQNGALYDAIAFNIDLTKWPNYRTNKAHIVYRLDINYYLGRSKLQLMVEHIESHD